MDEIDGTATVDLSLRTIWRDPRWDIPDLWKYINPVERAQGVIITKFVEPDGLTEPLHIWKPDVYFRDSSKTEVLNSVFRFRQGGELYYSCNMFITLAQPNLDFNRYPMDTQHIELVMQSSSYGVSQMYLNYSVPPVVYVSTPDGNDVNFEKNVIWAHKAGDYYAEKAKQVTYLGDSETTKVYDVLTIFLRVTRESNGVVLRFLLPILALMVMGGWIFWIAVEERANATLNVLVAVSAMYIIVFSNIPLVGYLTTLDVFIMEVYSMMVICIGIHQLCFKLVYKADYRPLRHFAARTFEFIGRMVVVPYSVIRFFEHFGEKHIRGSLHQFKIPTYTILAVALTYIFIREYSGMEKSFREMIEAIEQKKRDSQEEPRKEKNGSDNELTWAEVMTYWIYSVSCCRARNESRKRGSSVHIQQRRNRKQSVIIQLEERISTSNPVAAVASSSGVEGELGFEESGQFRAQVEDENL